MDKTRRSLSVAAVFTIILLPVGAVSQQMAPAAGALPAAIKADPLPPDRERALMPKDSFKECDNCPVMIVVPAGSFMMGSPASEPLRHSSESPQHRVTFAKAFAVGKISVTFDEWDACVADRGCNGYRPNDIGWGRGKQPVMMVSWDDAKTYVAWLSRKTGKSYRLLSEAEREYVTRAGTMTTFWWGSSIATSQANYDGNRTYEGGSKGDYRGKTLPVDSLAPNPWELHHVHGNVWEWTEDCWNENYNNAPADGSAWTAGDCTRRMQRGGSFFGDPRDLRAAARAVSNAGFRDAIMGFRVARTLAQ